MSPPRSATEPMTQPDAIAERNARIMDFEPMVRRVAYRMARRFPKSVDAEDLYHIGLIGLIEAVEKFDDSRAPSFAGYARMRVQGAILDEMRKLDWVPRSVRDRSEKLVRAKKDLTEDLGRPPTHAELADHLGVDEERLNQMMQTADVRTLVSTEEGSPEDGTVGDRLADPKADVHDDLHRMLVNEQVRSVLRALPERDQLIVDLYYYQDLTFKEIADILGVTESRVSQLHTRMKKRVRETLSSLSD